MSGTLTDTTLTDTTSDDVRIITNNVPRPVIDAWELTAKERAEFDYLDWAKIEQGEESATFFRYKGQLHDLSDIPAVWPERFGPTANPYTETVRDDSPFTAWDGIASDSFFSGILVRYVTGANSDYTYPDGEYIIVGRYYC